MPKLYKPTPKEKHLLELYEIRDRCRQQLLKVVKEEKTKGSGAYSDLLSKIISEITREENRSGSRLDNELIIRFKGLEASNEEDGN